jgi:peptidoglycan/LPS O-acetylase OafA/YrhL
VKAQHGYDVPLITLATGVWLFFGISGYVISRPFVDRLLTGRGLPSLRTYAIRRLLRIFPIYWVALTAVIVIAGTGATAGWQLPVHYLLLNNLIPGRQAALFPAAWTLTLEVLFYAAVPLIALALRRRRVTISSNRLAGIVAVSWIMSTAFTAFADLHGDGQTGLWLRESFPAMWQMFCPGIMLAIAPHLRSGRARRWLVDLPERRVALALMAATFVLAVALDTEAPLRFGVVVYGLLVDASRPLFAISYGLVIAAAMRARPWGREGGWLLRLGLVSYGIYLLHAVILTFLLGHSSVIPAPDTSAPAFVVHVAFLAALTVPLALISWSWLERPAIELSRRLSGSVPAVEAGPAPLTVRGGS